MGQRELEVLGEELPDVGAADVLGLLNLNDLEDVDSPEASAVTGGHVLVEGLDGVGAGHLTVLTVHVVSAGARVVADPDTNVLDLLGVLLGDLFTVSAREFMRRLITESGAALECSPQTRNTDLVQGNDLTVGLLDLAELGEEVPETALGDNRVGGEDTHAVELRGGLRVSGQMAPNDLVLLQATCWATESALSYGQYLCKGFRDCSPTEGPSSQGYAHAVCFHQTAGVLLKKIPSSFSP